MKDLKDKTALVTGAASGIGRALALELAREGAHLVLADVNATGLEEVEKIVAGMKRRVLSVPTDVSEAAEVKQLCERALAEMGGVDVLANVAGIGIVADLKDMEVEDWKRILGVNLMGPIHTLTYLLPSMIERRTGHIVNMASGAGLVAVPVLGAYSTTKFALVGLSETLRAELAPHRIGVTVVCPGGVKTPIFDAALYKNYNIRPFVDLLLKFTGWTPERMARVIVRGIKKNQFLVTGSIAAAGYLVKRISPGLVRWGQKLLAEYLARYKT